MPDHQTQESRSPSMTEIGIGVYFLAGPAVVALAGLGAYFGQKIGGSIGLWIGCYAAGIVASVVAGWVFSRLFRGNPLYWILGAFGMLAGGHLTWIVLRGTAGEGSIPRNSALLSSTAALAGMFLGFAAARSIANRRRASAA